MNGGIPMYLCEVRSIRKKMNLRARNVGVEYGDQVINLIRIYVRHLKGKQNTSERYKMYNLCGICAYLHDPQPTGEQTCYHKKSLHWYLMYAELYMIVWPGRGRGWTVILIKLLALLIMIINCYGGKGWLVEWILPLTTE